MSYGFEFDANKAIKEAREPWLKYNYKFYNPPFFAETRKDTNEYGDSFKPPSYKNKLWMDWFRSRLNIDWVNFDLKKLKLVE